MLEIQLTPADIEQVKHRRHRRRTVGGFLTAVVQTVDELAGFDAEAFCEFLDRRQPRLAAAALDPADAGQVDTRGVREAVLREAFPGAQLAHALAEGSAGAVGVLVDRLGHRESVAAPDRLDQSVTAVNLLAEGALVL